MGRGGSYADYTHEEKERGEGKAPFSFLRKKGPNESKKTFCRGGRLENKREKRLE
jgi:hypothetical protein